MSEGGVCAPMTGQDRDFLWFTTSVSECRKTPFVTSVGSSTQKRTLNSHRGKGKVGQCWARNLCWSIWKILERFMKNANAVRCNMRNNFELWLLSCNLQHMAAIRPIATRTMHVRQELRMCIWLCSFLLSVYSSKGRAVCILICFEFKKVSFF